MNHQDIRWQQRFSNYKKALLQLQNAVELSVQRALSNLEKQGVIQSFEFTHELAWNVLKDYLEDQGNQNVKGSKDATREAFKVALIADGEQWMAMIQSRNVSSNHGVSSNIPTFSAQIKYQARLSQLPAI